MTNATQTKPSRQRRKPARFCKLTRQGEDVVLLIREHYPRKGDVLDTYAAEVFPSQMGERGTAGTLTRTASRPHASTSWLC